MADYHAKNLKIDDNLAIKTEYELTIPTEEIEEHVDWLLAEKKNKRCKKEKGRDDI
jgi:hypothetical protein